MGSSFINMVDLRVSHRLDEAPTDGFGWRNNPVGRKKKLQDKAREVRKLQKQVGGPISKLSAEAADKMLG